MTLELPIGGDWPHESEDHVVHDPTKPRLVKLPREGYEIFFTEETHAYQPPNDKGKPSRKIPGASTIGGAFPDTPRPLMFWTEKMCLEGVARLRAAGVSIPTDPFVLRQLLENYELRWEQIRDKAAERGTNVHREMLEALARGGEIPDLDRLPEEHRGYGQAVFKWWGKRKPKPLHVEQIVYSKTFNFGGRFDLDCIIECPVGALEPCHGRGIVDLKTSAKGPYLSDHVQLRGYEIAGKECGVIDTDLDWLMVLKVLEDGSYEEHYIAATERAFFLALRSYQEAKIVSKAMNAGGLYMPMNPTTLDPEKVECQRCGRTWKLVAEAES